MLVLHHLTNSRSFRILWLLNELQIIYGVAFELVKHERTESYLAPDVLKTIHPMGKAPILVDTIRGRTLIESGFIIEYLLRYYDTDGVLSADDDEWGDFAFWLHFSESSMMPPLVMRLVMSKVATKSPRLVRPVARAIAAKVESLVIADNIIQSFGLLNEHLINKMWITSKFTAVDIQAYFAVKALENRSGLDGFEQLQAWLTRCEARVGYQQAVAQGGALFV